MSPKLAHAWPRWQPARPPRRRKAASSPWAPPIARSRACWWRTTTRRRMGRRTGAACRPRRRRHCAAPSARLSGCPARQRLSERRCAASWPRTLVAVVLQWSPEDTTWAPISKAPSFTTSSSISWALLANSVPQRAWRHCGRCVTDRSTSTQVKSRVPPPRSLWPWRGRAAPEQPMLRTSGRCSRKRPCCRCPRPRPPSPRPPRTSGGCLPAPWCGRMCPQVLKHRGPLSPRTFTKSCEVSLSSTCTWTRSMRQRCARASAS
mmetsp:Transcript_27673/g.91988  ORF Transcript_27673/g.91988 Transcript_27673/m.91988 type:complete len:262 (+) Transcript_27673:2973-3758(+)